MPLNKESPTSGSPKRRGCLRKLLQAGLIGIFVVLVGWQLLTYLINWMLDGTRAYQIPTPSYPLATITTEQLNERLVVSLPNSTVTVEMVYVPAGEFLMGNDSESFARPIHEVYLDAFWMDRTEVTNAQFAVFEQATGYQTTAEQAGMSDVLDHNRALVRGANWRHPQGPDSSIEERADHPVVQLSWYDAFAYCQWRGARLPTEAEWEKGARGIDGRIYPWGSQITGAELNYCDSGCIFHQRLISLDDGYVRTAPVGSFPDGASPYGAMDMAGNVYEYTADWFDSNYYAQSPDSNPTGPLTEDIPAPNIVNHWVGGLKALRGGSWIAIHPDDFTTYYRNTTSLKGPSDYVGFRCVSN